MKRDDAAKTLIISFCLKKKKEKEKMDPFWSKQFQHQEHECLSGSISVEFPRFPGNPTIKEDSRHGFEQQIRSCKWTYPTSVLTGPLSLEYLGASWPLMHINESLHY